MKNRKLVLAIAAVIGIMTCLSIPALAAGYVYGTSNKDAISSPKPVYDFPSHIHSKIEIGASPINVTSPPNTAVGYWLSLYVNGQKYGGDVICNTSGVGGGYHWPDPNPNSVNVSAFIRLTKVDSSNNTTLGGSLTASSRSWT